MKVVCDSCQAKYQVPDERVAGKKLKIRCKRCGATVLIRGDLLGVGGEGSELNQTLSGGAAPDMLDMSGAERASLPPEAIALGELARGQHGMHGDEDFEWHVSLDGDTQGPFSTAALQDWLNNTPSGWEAHVWREGFPDWLDARACAELGPAPAAPAMSSLQDDELPTATFNASSYEGAAFMADLAAAPRSQPRIQTQQTAQSGAYAAQQDAASFSGSYATAGSVRPVASAGGATYTPGPNPGFASGEASGLIDIRALASLARQSTTQIAKNADNTGSVKNNARASQQPKANAANGAHGPNTASHKTGSTRPDASLSYGNDDDARIALAAQPSGFGRFDSLAPVSNSVSSNAALPLAILGGCALVAAAVLAAVLFNKKPAADTANAPAPTHQDHQQSESAATAMPPGEPGMDQNKDKPKANPDQHPAGQEEEPTVAPASVEAAESDELSKAKRMRGPQPASPVIATAEKDAPTAAAAASPEAKP
ncbi:MAG TPA: GYF domain-containing protein, partial [Polyangiales bacterium]|nr:GYF domain-containing protein [Polyangiales bacterium]